MAVVKISELPAMQQIAGSDILPIVDTSETETKKVTKQMLLTNIDASEVNIGQLNEATQINDEDYLIITQNGLNKKISKANARFASGDEISIGTTQPVEDEKLWINPEELPSGSLNPITNEYSVAQDKGYSCNYLNEKFANMGKTLWTGSFTSGSISVPDLSKYWIIGIIADGVLCIGTKSFGGGIYGTYGGTTYGVVSYRLSSSGDTFEINTNDKGAFNNGTQVAITRIIGIF